MFFVMRKQELTAVVTLVRRWLKINQVYPVPLKVNTGKCQIEENNIFNVTVLLLLPSESKLFGYFTSNGPCKIKTCAKCVDSDHPANAQIRAFAVHSYVL